MSKHVSNALLQIVQQRSSKSRFLFCPKCLRTIDETRHGALVFVGNNDSCCFTMKECSRDELIALVQEGVT
jgi:hypothetical protein